MSEAFFSPGDEPRLRIAYRLRNCRRTADICVFTITDDRIAGAILDAHHNGIKVRILSDDDKAFDRGSDIDRLAAAGIEVRVDRTEYHMHHKFAIFDGENLLCGSYNWTRGAANDNCENLIDTTDASLLTLFAREFEKLWEKLK